MAEAADAEAMRKQLEELKKEMEMMRRIIKIQNKLDRVNKVINYAWLLLTILVQQSLLCFDIKSISCPAAK